jgi:hypothetical protein
MADFLTALSRVAMAELTSDSDNLFFDAMVRGYVDGNPRFVHRDCLAAQLHDKLKETSCRFVLLTAEPGAGKSAS